MPVPQMLHERMITYRQVTTWQAASIVWKNKFQTLCGEQSWLHCSNLQKLDGGMYARSWVLPQKQEVNL